MNPKHKIAILLLDGEDSLIHAKLVEAKQQLKLTFHITIGRSLAEARELLAKQEFNLILSELSLSDSEGIETYTHLSQIAEFTPIVIVSDTTLALEIVAQGAQDCIPTNELTAQLLGRVVQYAIERHHLQESLRTLSLTDELTGLYNRRGFTLLVKQQMELALRVRRGLYLFFLDLDYLKSINDTFGHQVGDQALLETAAVMRETFRKSDIMARIGGDEFAVVSIHVPKEKGKILRRHLEETVASFNAQKPRPFELSISIGMSYFDPAHPQSLDELLTEADENLYSYKRMKH